MNGTTEEQAAQAEPPVPVPQWGDEAALRSFKLPPRPETIPGFLPIGLVLLFADAKIGKSYIAQQIEHNLSYGRPLGDFPIDKPVCCLVIDLEGDYYIAQERSLEISPMGTVPGDEGYDGSGNGKIALTFDWPSASSSFDDRVAMLERELAKAPAVRYVRIDSLALFTGGNASGENAYHADYRKASVLNRLALKHNVTIFAMHHVNKSGGESGDWVRKQSGSNGLVAGAAALMYLERVRGADTGVLHVTGRTVREAEHAMTFDNGMWQFDPDLSLTEARHTKTPRLILDILRVGPALGSDIVAKVGGPAATVKKNLQRLQDNGEIRYRSDGLWSLEEEPRASNRILGGGDTGDAEDTGDTGDIGDVGSDLPSEDDEETEEKPEAYPALKIMGACFTSKYSRMKPLPVIRKADREQDPWASITERMSGGAHYWHVDPTTLGDRDGWAVTLDRNGSYPSACSSVPVAPNKLLHDPELRTLDRERAGVYLIEHGIWDETHIGSPLGRHPGDPHGSNQIGWFGDVHLEGLDKVGQPYTIHDAWVGNRNLSLFEPFYKAIRQARADLRDDPERYADMKTRSSIAIRLLYPRQKRSPFWRPDWYFAIVAQANFRHWIKAQKALADGEVILSMDGTDEVVFWTDDPDPAWLPVGYEVGPNFGQVKIKDRTSYRDWRQGRARTR